MDHSRPLSGGTTAARNWFERASSDSASSTSAGVSTRTTPRLTIPLAFEGSSSCSQTATLCPISSSRGMYAGAAW